MNEKDFNLNYYDEADRLKTMEEPTTTKEPTVTEEPTAMEEPTAFTQPETCEPPDFVTEGFATETRTAADSIEHSVTIKELVVEEITAQKPAYAPEIFYNENVKPVSKEKKSHSFKHFVAAALIVSLVGGSAFGFSLGASQQLFANKTPQAQSVATEIPSTEIIGTPLAASEFSFDSLQATPVSFAGQISSVSDIIDLVEPSVVALTVLQQQTSYYFNQRQSTPREGSGSGIIFRETSDKIYIVTNNHVVENAISVSVSIGKSEPIKASYIGSDSQNDLAVISINKSDLQAAGVKSITVASFGDSDKLRVGDLAIAIGNALGEGNTATAGIISAVNKSINDGDKVLDVLQTDAAINPGNSGGPLVNASGEVIGINTAKLSDTQVEGMGFAIPISVAKPIIEELVNKGYISRPYMGISGSNLSEEAAELYDVPMGVLIRQLVSGGPAELAGLQVSDIIIDVDGNKIITMDNLTTTIQKHKVGDTLNITIVRNGTEKMTLPVTLQDSNSTTVETSKW